MKLEKIVVDYSSSLPFELFYQRLIEEGYRHFFRNDMIRKELIVFFTQEGWKYHEFKLVSQYKITLNLLVRFIRNKIFSHQRKIPEEMYIIGLKHLYRELENRGINLTQEIAIPAHAHLLMFFPS